MNLQEALSSRPVIDQALGILMSRTGRTAEECFDRPRTLSQSENTSALSPLGRVPLGTTVVTPTFFITSAMATASITSPPGLSSRICCVPW